MGGLPWDIDDFAILQCPLPALRSPSWLARHEGGATRHLNGCFDLFDRAADLLHAMQALSQLS